MCLRIFFFLKLWFALHWHKNRLQHEQQNKSSSASQSATECVAAAYRCSSDAQCRTCRAPSSSVDLSLLLPLSVRYFPRFESSWLFGKCAGSNQARERGPGMEKYEKLAKMGEGSYGIVIKCRHRVSCLRPSCCCNRVPPSPARNGMTSNESPWARASGNVRRERCAAGAWTCKSDCARWAPINTRQQKKEKKENEEEEARSMARWPGSRFLRDTPLIRACLCVPVPLFLFSSFFLLFFLFLGSIPDRTGNGADSCHQEVSGDGG